MTDPSHPAAAVEDPFSYRLVPKGDSRIHIPLAPASTCEPASKHVCHCGKAFIRKEHLRRHQATHGERNFTFLMWTPPTPSCDLLRRHMARHDLTSAAPDSRRGRACDACHANKTKCDGGAQCSLCSKRGISCTYKLAATGSKPNGASRNEVQPITDAASLIRISTAEGEITDDSSTPTSGTLSTPRELGDNPAAAGLARFANILTSSALSEEFKIPQDDQAWIEEATDEYLGRFHQCWPVIHAPTFYSMPPPVGLTATVAMIGAWLKHPVELKHIATELHARLMDKFFEELGEKVVARAVLLKGMLVAILREIEFFVCSSSGHQQRIHFPGTFLPWVQSIRERWKRTIAALYKIDAYMSISRWQPPTIHREELDVALPSTFALWNAYGLDVFFKRLPGEPADRTSYKLSEITCNPNSRARSLLLLEDVQLALCGLSPGIWNHLQITRRSGKVGLESLRSLAWHLETWKAEMERISHQCSQSYGTEETAGLPFVAYLGRFDEDPARERRAATSQIKSLVSDALMLYHIQGMQLYADVRTINAVALYLDTPVQNEPSIPPRIQNYQALLHEWAVTPESRRALLHAIGVLRMREVDLDGDDAGSRDIDPVAYLALAISALVVWAWVTYAETRCSCLPSMDHIDIGVDPPDLQSTTRLESWIHGGGTAAVQGISFCRCVVDGWMARFAATLPQGGRIWELGDGIAPMLKCSRKL
ncbi:hypothetical protein B0T10DRAFT_532888 [Thelonectria olida]|uniref:Zn(2)-C6 fungal-type domain-containing protein n=1 Tax=Thelonectria olida TaxID=1576542 RepID=A0A9P8VTF9_9HYPO|nr:hypothetical protein B0T10DRAFT_532888 [Thelonectria olida]